MHFSEKDVKFETTKGSGPGGQHRNKTESAVRATHLPTGISVFIDGRKQHQNKKKALKILKKRIFELQNEERASEKKDRRDKAIKDKTVVRTYDFSRGVVKDHRSGKTSSLKNVLVKGKLDVFYDE